MVRSLQVLLRIRDRGKMSAQTALRQAETAREAQAAALDHLEARLERSREAAELDPVELARHHAYALQMEMTRRAGEQDLVVREREVADCRDRLRDAARGHRVVEIVMENRAQVAERRAKRLETSQLDELGVQAWWRSSA
jgi:flagellar export protein FliJ